MVQPEFGRRLRRARLGAGLSQLELAGDAYTNSYVSYLESGRRAPTQEVAEYLAGRLGTSAAALGFSPDDASGIDTRITHELLVGDKAISRHEWGGALAAAERALGLAAHSTRQERRWESLHLKCRTLLESGDFEAAAALAGAMAADQIADLSGLLRAEAHTLAARALRGSGQLVEAAIAARAALAALSAVDATEKGGIDDSLEVEGLLQFVAARAELGDPPETLAGAVARLATLAEGLEAGHTRGRVLWTIGNLAHLAGDAATGAAAHSEAADMILAPVDLALFGRLHRVIAHYRLVRGEVAGVADELAVARQASELVGRQADLMELAVDEARLLLLEGRATAALALLDQTLASEVMEIAFVGRAETYEARGEVLAHLRRDREARASYRQAALDFEAMQAIPRALAAWRLAAGQEEPAGGAATSSSAAAV